MLKVHCLTVRGVSIRYNWSHIEVRGIAGVVVKCVDIGRNTEGEASELDMC
jgi:hypothetical protein